MNRTNSMLPRVTSGDQVHVEDLLTDDMPKQGEKDAPRTSDAVPAPVDCATQVLSDGAEEVCLDDDNNNDSPCDDMHFIMYDPLSSLIATQEDPHSLHSSTLFSHIDARSFPRSSARSEGFMLHSDSASPSAYAADADKENRPPPNFDVTATVGAPSPAVDAETAVSRTAFQGDTGSVQGLISPRRLFTSADDVFVSQDSDRGSMRSPRPDNYSGNTENMAAWENGFRQMTMGSQNSDDAELVTIHNTPDCAIRGIMEVDSEDFVTVASQSYAVSGVQEENDSFVVPRSVSPNNVEEDEFATICNTNTVCSEDLMDRDNDLACFSSDIAPVAGVTGQKRNADERMRPHKMRRTASLEPAGERLGDTHERHGCMSAGGVSQETSQSEPNSAAQPYVALQLDAPFPTSPVMSAPSTADFIALSGSSITAYTPTFCIGAVGEQQARAAGSEEGSGRETPFCIKRFRSPKYYGVDLSKRRKKAHGAAQQDENEQAPDSAVTSPVERRLSRSVPGTTDTTSVVVMVESRFVSAIITKLHDIKSFLSSSIGSDVTVQIQYSSTLSPGAAQQRRVTFKGKGLTQVACIDSILRFIPVGALNSDEFEKTPEEVIFAISAKDREAMIAYGISQVSRDLSEFLRSKGHHVASRFMSVLLLETPALSTWKVKVLGVPESWGRNVVDFFRPKVQYLEMDGTLLKDANVVLESFGHDNNDSVVAYLTIPQTDVSRLIGRDGSSLELLQKETCTMLAIDQCSKDSGYSTLLIKGQSCKVCQFAKDRILRFLEHQSATSNTNVIDRRASMSQ
eukprot:GEMP01003369.1.p1 GENE.GEMP01003369.1~~GEMP01003369.1.p1  ORF type:complete len:797 (+),score=178.13 GEMP01003369.1:291-2681(+)